MSAQATEIKIPEMKNFFIKEVSGEKHWIGAHDFSVQEGFLKFTRQGSLGVRIMAVFKDWACFYEVEDEE